MLYGIIGRYNDITAGSVRGNGKTCATTYLSYIDYKDGNDIYTNYHTSFSTYITINELMELFHTGKIINATVVIDEIQKFLNNSGVSVYVRTEIINSFIAQSRKIETDIYFTVQRYKQIHPELRDQCDKILITIKFHYTKNKKGKIELTEICKKDNKCREKHIILLYSLSDDEFLSYVIYPEITGKYYNTNEVIYDKFDESKNFMSKALLKKQINKMSIEELEKALKKI